MISDFFDALLSSSLPVSNDCGVPGLEVPTFKMNKLNVIRGVTIYKSVRRRNFPNRKEFFH